MRLGLALAATAALAVPLAVVAKQSFSPAITKALADPARSDAAGDDVRRKAAESLAFSGVKPGWTVIDYLPGQGYWTHIFTGIVGPTGHVYAFYPHLFAKRAETPLAKINGWGLANLTAEAQATDIPTAPQPVDLFWTVENYHDAANVAGETGLTAFNKGVLATLKPGGYYVIIDHAAAAGSGLRDTITLHRIDPAIVKKEVLAAGFQWVGESAVLANKDDDHTLKVFDPKVRGKTDQFVYKFRKPLK